MLTDTSAVLGLTAEIATLAPPLSRQWPAVHEVFLRWVPRPGFSEHLRQFVLGLPAAEVTARSRETTTHFAWCLLDDPGAEFSLWLHEYKPQRDWRHGYAESVHNHRYHFSTAMLRGGYLQECYDAAVDAQSGMITSVNSWGHTVCDSGSTGMVLASDFHRIAAAADDTMTFLIKSRPVTAWSLSFDPQYGTGHRHVPVENRWEEISGRI